MLKSPLPALLVLWATLRGAAAHGRLIEPPSRASAWRYGFDTPHNYNDHELYCGGFSRQWLQNAGNCGVCGDAWDAPPPRPHEYGGIYGRGVIVRRYEAGAVVTLRVELTANHQGHFQFGLCPDYKTTTQECIDANLLRLLRPQDGVDHRQTRYFPKGGNRVYEIKYRLPKKSCTHCLLQWRYVAANNWGTCPNGTGGVGCGPQEEFRACADIAISGRTDADEAMQPPTTAGTHASTTPTPATDPDGEPHPFSALVIGILSFLAVFLMFFLIYFHFYEVGRQIKTCLKGSTAATKAPQPPPRGRRAGKALPSAHHDGDDSCKRHPPQTDSLV